MLLIQLYTRVDILVTRGRHLYDRIIPLKDDIWAHKTRLTPPLLINVRVARRKGERSCIRVLIVNTFIVTAGTFEP
jgi:hypothetical protein